MKKLFKSYISVWVILFLLFNVIAFVSVGWSEQEKYTPSFWIGYVFITAAFFGQLACSYLALNETNAQKLFYNISLITTSYAGLVATFFVGGLCMLISRLPYWVGVITCAAVMAINVIAVIKASIAIELVSAVDKKIKANTFFIKNLTVEAEALLNKAKSSEEKAICKKVYEALRYSDPMSNDKLSEIEETIGTQFKVFSKTFSSDLAEELLSLIDERNKKCRLGK